ncbi:recombinase family protein [Neisseria sp. 83E34]|uniref:recombinase family protein n=1 Tax=Neisseria sp. 83E34 TaxID=1692264 RepID=UPI0006CE885D|nr:recombinase family protein [Neisseria sp. 83E34]KPN72641.1 hypothetical protein AKG09_02085 [Neisseria sp. 83E34]
MEVKIARIYMRVSTDEQNLERQQRLVDEAEEQGFYIADIYAGMKITADTNILLRAVFWKNREKNQAGRKISF